ncbi:hypothetical protein ACFLRI_00830 [Bacteroidota bacterium]
MKSAKTLNLLLAGIMVFSGLAAQNYGPEKVKTFDSRILKSKSLLVPIVDKVPDKCKDMSTWRSFNTATKVENEWKRRVDEAMANSSFDFLSYEVKNFNPEQLKKEKDRTTVALYFDKDFYQNLYVYIAVAEPKWQVIATAPVNGLMLSEIKDLTFMFNMLQYSMITACEFYGDNFKPLYRGHEFKYMKAIDQFTDDIRSKLFLVPKLDKKQKGYGKKNEKMNEYLKLDWKLTSFDLIYQADINTKINSGFDGMYMQDIPIYTANPKVDYHFVIWVTAPDKNVLFWQLQQTDLKPAYLKFAQSVIDEWIVMFMEPKKQRSYSELKVRESAAVSTPQPSQAGKKGTSKSTPPKQATPKTKTEKKPEEGKTK